VAVYVIGASVVLAHLNDEPGKDVARDFLADDSVVSAVNFAEVVSKMSASSRSTAEVESTLGVLGLAIVPFDEALALLSGQIHAATRHLGLSMADAACVATARALGATAVTADRTWAALPDEVRIIR
jgi:ribonuclease VapC